MTIEEFNKLEKNKRYEIIDSIMGDDFIFWYFPENEQEKNYFFNKHYKKLMEKIKNLKLEKGGNN